MKFITTMPAYILGARHSVNFFGLICVLFKSIYKIKKITHMRQIVRMYLFSLVNCLYNNVVVCSTLSWL